MKFGSNRRADHTNRLVLSVLGLALVGAGAAGLLVSYLDSTSDETPLDTTQRSWLIDNGTLIGIAALVAVALITIACLAWLRRQISPISELSDLTVGDDDFGRTTLDVGALTSTIEDELTEVRGVEAATARFRANDPSTIEVLVDVDDRSSVDRIAHEVSDDVLARARQALAWPELHLALEVRSVQIDEPSRAA